MSSQSAVVAWQAAEELPNERRADEAGHQLGALGRHPAFLSKVVVERPQIQSALAVLAELHQFESPTSPHVVLPTGFDPLDEVLAGGIRPGELLLVGGKPGVGKTIATRQWARSVAQRGGVAVYLCFEHDQVTMLSRLLSCELGEVIAIHPARNSRVEGVELQGRIRDVAAGAITLQQALDSDPLIDEAHRRLAAYADRLVFVTGSGDYPNVNAIGEITQRFEGQSVALFVDYVQKVPHLPACPDESERVGRVIEGLKQLALDQELAVVVVAAADQSGLDARRTHMRHFRGSTALAYEADAVVVLNEKVAVASRAPIAHHPDPRRGAPAPRRVLGGEEPQWLDGRPLGVREGLRPLPLPPAGPLGRRPLWTEGSTEQ